MSLFVVESQYTILPHLHGLINKEEYIEFKVIVSISLFLNKWMFKQR